MFVFKVCLTNTFIQHIHKKTRIHQFYGQEKFNILNQHQETLIQSENNLKIKSKLVLSLGPGISSQTDAIWNQSQQVFTKVFVPKGEASSLILQKWCCWDCLDTWAKLAGRNTNINSFRNIFLSSKNES